MSSKSRPYLSYLLRMWQVQAADRLEWRASLENPHTGEKFFFASLPLLFKFLLSHRQEDVSGAPGTRPDPMEEA